jgi:virginiamycin B lyase
MQDLQKPRAFAGANCVRQHIRNPFIYQNLNDHASPSPPAESVGVVTSQTYLAQSLRISEAWRVLPFCPAIREFLMSTSGWLGALRYSLRRLGRSCVPPIYSGIHHRKPPGSARRKNVLALEPLEMRLAPAIGLSEFSIPTANSQPQGITAGPDGALWFTQIGSNQIGRINTSGAFTEFPLPTANSQPGGITTGPDGNLWFTEQSIGKIGRITPGGTLSEFALSSSSTSPHAIIAGPDGALWFTESGTNKIGRITTDGSTINEYTIPTSNSFPIGIAVGADGALWFTENFADKIGRITTSGSISEFAVPTNGGHNQPYGITAGSDGALWFTESVGNKIGRITTSGTLTEYPLPTENSFPHNISTGPDGALWFTESAGNKIGQITTSGNVTEVALPVGSSQPEGIALGSDGGLWFTQQTGNWIGKLTVDQSTAHYVTALYHDLLGRTPDDGGLNYWTQLLNTGTTREQVALAIWQSAEHFTLEVNTYYQTFLHRAADAGGLAYWVGALQAGADETTIIQGFLTSSEYLQAHPDNIGYINALYSDLLGRPADSAGFTYWTNLLNSGTSRVQVAHGFVHSGEYEGHLLDLLYSTYLHRAADSGGASIWYNALQAGTQTYTQVAINFLASDEYFGLAQK